jgi:hypothetical protein
MRSFMKGSKNVMMEHVEQLILTIGSDDQEVRRSALASLRCVLCHIQAMDVKLALKRRRTAKHQLREIGGKGKLKLSAPAPTRKKVRAKIEIRAREIAQTVCEGLVSLQILLEEVSLLSAIVRVVKEVLILIPPPTLV